MMMLPRPFDSERWKAAGHDADLRCTMVTDLKHRVGLIGKTKQDVLQLLGRPDDQNGGLPTGYLLCPSLFDFYILRLGWRDDRVASATLGST